MNVQNSTAKTSLREAITKEDPTIIAILNNHSIEQTFIPTFL
jgi:hypothetical protein